MTTGQTISIISAVIVSGIIVAVSIAQNQPKVVVGDSNPNDQMNVDSGNERSDNIEVKKWSLKDIIESVTSKN